MDSLVEENGIRYLKHYLLDFGSILGSAGVRPKYPWIGTSDTSIEQRTALVQMVTFGFYVPRWARAEYPKLHGRGTVRLLVLRSALVEVRIIRIRPFS